MPLLYKKRTEGKKTIFVFSRRRRRVLVGVGVISLAVFWVAVILGQSSPYFYPLLLVSIAGMFVVSLVALVAKISLMLDRMSAAGRISRRSDSEKDVITVEK